MNKVQRRRTLMKCWNNKQINGKNMWIWILFYIFRIFAQDGFFQQLRSSFKVYILPYKVKCLYVAMIVSLSDIPPSIIFGLSVSHHIPKTDSMTYARLWPCSSIFLVKFSIYRVSQKNALLAHLWDPDLGRGVFRGKK